MKDTEALLKHYLRMCWVIKIRLMSCRVHLWQPEVSLIHLETAALQISKICEGVMALCLIAGNIDRKDIPKKYQKKYRVGEVLKYLEHNNMLRLPHRARLTQASEKQGHWFLKIHNADEPEMLKRIITTWNKTGNILHEFSSPDIWPDTEETAVTMLLGELNAIRSDHQFLWNYLWQHALILETTEIFVVNMVAADETTRPTIIRMENFGDINLDFAFQPKFVSDFSEPIDWDHLDLTAVKVTI